MFFNDADWKRETFALASILGPLSRDHRLDVNVIQNSFYPWRKCDGCRDENEFERDIFWQYVLIYVITNRKSSIIHEKVIASV